MLGKSMSIRHALTSILLLLALTACTHIPPRMDTSGAPQREYTYQVPLQLDDGWQVSSLAKEGVNAEMIHDLLKAILAGHYPKTHSLLLVKNGKLVLEEYFYGNKRDDLHYLASATKSVTSLLIGISVDQDFLTGVDQNVSDWFNDYRRTKWISQKYDIKIKHLLSMTAGIEWDENRSASSPKHDYYAMRRGGDWKRYVFNKERVAPPGQKFNYNGGLSALLGVIIKRASGIDAEKFSEKYLFDPLGISHYGWLKYNDGSINTGGGLLLRSRDMAKIGQIVLGNGKFKDKRIVSGEWILESTENQPLEKAHPLGTGYGYQWWLGERTVNGEKIKIVIAQGRGGQCLFIVPKANAIAVVTSQLANNSGGFFRPQVMMTEYILPALFPRAALTEIATVDPVILETYAGRYEENWFHFKASVTVVDDKLILVPHIFGEKVELVPTSETTFQGKLDNIGHIEVRFANKDNGIADLMTVRIGFTHMVFNKIRPPASDL